MVSIIVDTCWGDQCKSVKRQKNCSRGKSELSQRCEHKRLIVLHRAYVNIIFLSDLGLLVARRATQKDTD